jgi:serine protease Do
MRFAPHITLLLVLLLPGSRAAAQAPTAAVREPQSRPAPKATALPLADLSQSLQALAAKVSPSVVQIFVTGYTAPDEEDRGASGEPQLERSSGSGVIVDPDGYIVTNAHVVENATRIEVELPLDATGGAPARSILKRRGRTVGGQIVAIDHETDIAVVKVEARGLPALPFGDSDDLRSGQLVLAFGSPLGLESSVSMGVVSAVARQLTPEDPMIYIQTDATINPGNSGGALVDTEGRLVGVNTLIYSQSGGSEGIGFAAPSNIVRNVFAQIRQYGRVRRGEIGVNPQTITPLLAEAMGLTFDAGVVLSDVMPGGPAAKAGLEPGDVVLTLDGKPMENGRQFRINVYTRGIGEQVAIAVRRGDRTLTARVPVAERQNDTGQLEALIGAQQAIRTLGVVALDLTAPIVDMLPPVRRNAGAVVARVTFDAPYSQQGRLQPGDVILEFNRVPIEDQNHLCNVVCITPLAKSIPVLIYRDRRTVLINIEVSDRGKMETP